MDDKPAATTDTPPDVAPAAPVKPKPVGVPRIVIRSIWAMHRALYRGTGGRIGLRAPKLDSYGMLRLRTVGRRSGEERLAILAYIDDGPDLILVAMNGWAEAAPAWWLNLQAHPDATVDLPTGSRTVTAREANPDERARLWSLLAEPWGRDRDAYAAGVSHEVPVVILEPRPAAQAPDHPAAQILTDGHAAAMPPLPGSDAATARQRKGVASSQPM